MTCQRGWKTLQFFRTCQKSLWGEISSASQEKTNKHANMTEGLLELDE